MFVDSFENPLEAYPLKFSALQAYLLQRALWVWWRHQFPVFQTGLAGIAAIEAEHLAKPITANHEAIAAVVRIILVVSLATGEAAQLSCWLVCGKVMYFTGVFAIAADADVAL